MNQPRSYLDAGGRAPVHPVAREAYLAALDEGWADPRRLHGEGRRARGLLDSSREALAGALGCRTEEVHLLGNHTLALHHAVLAVSNARRRRGTRVVRSAVERAAVHQAAAVVDPPVAEDHVDPTSVVPVGPTGAVDLDAWVAAVSAPGTALAALQHANGEVGTRQPLSAAWAAAHEAGVPLLVDAGASLGHDPVGDDWDLLTADPGDWGGVPGVAVLAARSRVRTRPTWPEDPDVWFPGGVSVPAAVAAAATLRAVLADQEEAGARRRAWVDRIRRTVAGTVPAVEVVGDPEDRLPHVLTFSCLYVDGESLVGELDRRGFAIGSGSACTSATLQPSHVLAAMGTLTQGNVRVALSRETTEAEVSRFCAELPGAVSAVRRTLGVHDL